VWFGRSRSCELLTGQVIAGKEGGAELEGILRVEETRGNPSFLKGKKNRMGQPSYRGEVGCLKYN